MLFSSRSTALRARARLSAPGRGCRSAALGARGLGAEAGLSCRRHIVKLLSLALLTLSSGCASAVEHEYVNSWFRVEKTERTVFAPHVIEWGGARRGQVRVDGDWTTVQQDDFSAVPMGEAVAVQEWSPWSDTPPHRTHRTTRVFIYRQGEVEPVAIPPSECPTPVISDAPPGLGCFSCRGGQGLESVRSADDCRQLRVRTFDSRGKKLTDQTIDSPIQVPTVEGRLPTGEWLLAEAKPSEDVLFFYGPRRRFALAGVTILELPYGSDPLSKDLNAAVRAKTILAEVPVRDAAMAELWAAHAVEEAARPERTLVDTLDNHLRQGAALEPRVPVRAGTCYEVVVRSSADLEEIKLFVGWDYTYLEKSLARPTPFWVEQTSAALVARLSYCVAGAPLAELLEFRIEAGRGSGYVSAKLYSYPAPAVDAR